MPEAMVMIVGEDHAVAHDYHNMLRSQGLRTLHIRPTEMAPTLYYRTLPNLIWLDGDDDFYQNAHLLNFLDTLPPTCQPQIILSGSPALLHDKSLGPFRHLIGGVFSKPVQVMEMVPLVVALATDHAERPPCSYFVLHPLASNESVYFLQLRGQVGADQLAEIGASLRSARGLICDLRGLAPDSLAVAVQHSPALPRVETALVVHHPADEVEARALAAARCRNATHYFFQDIGAALDFASKLY